MTTVESVVGVWNLVSFYGECQITSERSPILGLNPLGRLILSSEGYMIGIITARGRSLPLTAADRSAAFDTQIAYSGKYSISDGKFITLVDMSCNETWVGTAQIRHFQLHRSRLKVVSEWMNDPFKGNEGWRGILEWRREA